MNILKRSLRRLNIIALLIALASTPVAASLVTEYCNQPSNTNLWSGGSGWGTAVWDGFHNGPYCGADDLAWNQTGYLNTDNDAANGGRIEFQSYNPKERWLPQPITGAAWFSTLIISYINGNGGADSIFFGNINDPRIQIGVDTYAFIQYGTPSGIVRQNGQFVYNGVHLLIARFDLNYDGSLDRVKLWVDPEVLTAGESGLGQPAVMIEGIDLTTAVTKAYVALVPGNAADAIRISFPGETPASLEEVLTGEPAPAPSPTATSTVSTSETPTPFATATNTPSPSPTASLSPTALPTNTPTVTPSPTQTLTPTFPRTALRCQRALNRASRLFVGRMIDDVSACGLALLPTNSSDIPSACSNDAQVSAAFATEGVRLRRALIAYCDDSDLEAMRTCGSAVDAVVSVDGLNGCLIELLRAAVFQVADAEFGS